MSKREAYEMKSGPSAKDGAPIFWKSLEEKAHPVESALRKTAEFPREEGGVGPVGRRGFLFGGLASAMLAVEGCARRPVENILPYTKAPEYQLPGIPSHYATVRASRGDAIGLIVQNHEGRPTKIEGNPEHPSSMGAADLLTQASILDLYDPDRSTSPMHGGKAATWAEADKALAEKLAAYAADGGAKLRVLTAPTLSPTFMRLRDALVAKMPHTRVHTWASVSDSNVREGARIAFGQPVSTQYEYGLARVVLSLDADFLQTETGSVRAARAFSRGRRLTSARDSMNRLYVVEPSFSTTGASADHRLRLPASKIEAYLLALAKELSTRPGVDFSGIAPAFASAAAPEGLPAQWLKVVADDLAKNRGRTVVVAGSRQPARVHALVHAINAGLGNEGGTVHHFPVTDASETPLAEDLKALVDDMSAGRVETLVILGGNPVYDAPADYKFADALGKVANAVHLSDRNDETSTKCAWHLPMAHELETWGDLRAVEGTLSVAQPLIAPLHDGRSAIEILGMLTGEKPNGYELVRTTIKAGAQMPGMFESQWKVALHKGVFTGTAARPFPPMPTRSAETVAAFSGVPAAKPLSKDNLEVAFSACPKMYDGRHANNPWLLECPDLMTKITWDNAAVISPATAKELGVASGDVVKLEREGAGSIEIAAWILPGHADHSVSLVLGWGRTLQGRYGVGSGFDVGPLRTSSALGFGDGARITKTGKTYLLAQTQEHQSMEGRPLAIDATVAEYRENPHFTQYKSQDAKTLPLWKPVEYNNHKWGMTIDLTACTGCNACVIACQSENNVATVGKDQVSRNREMFWIRIDRYFMGEDENDPGVALQPVACVQCEDAPCENVCPVNATTHSSEGLNDMAYNRCIGTRYCANNCPYKVRRFNFLEFMGGPIGGGPDTLYGDLPETRKMQFNPDVTVRMRGVMEKCTYCVQRIQEVKIAAKREDRPVDERTHEPAIRDGEIVTACQQTCPSDAIVFGDLNDPRSRVARMAAVDRHYELLSEIGTHPRTKYLGKIRNPNPDMPGGEPAGEKKGG